MLEAIRNHQILSKYIIDECCEGNVSVKFDVGIQDDKYVIVKVDDYYNSLNIEQRPPSPDCLIILECENEGYGLVIVELKDIQSSRNFSVDNVVEKFKTCLNDFVGSKFKNILFVNYKSIKLFFVTNIDVYKRDIGLKMETMINYKLTYKDKSYLIRPYLPVPAIKKCY